ncbi:VCBS domain-containing protein, partial [Vibrio cyclitrophicus]
NESETVTYTIPTADGADTETITITINGAEDDSEITLETGDSDTGSVTEDVAVTDGNLTTTGSVTLTDADGDGAFGTPVFDADNSTVSSELGSLSIAADGTWTYTVNNDAVQYLDA